MRAIEEGVFQAGMPVAALMEKAGTLLAQRIMELCPRTTHGKIGILAGPGHNGGDAWVVARELHLRGYQVSVWAPSPRPKPLTADHQRYGLSLGISRLEDWDFEDDRPREQDAWVDGLLGFGLEQPPRDPLDSAIQWLNRQRRQSPRLPVISLDLPSGLHTDNGQTLGVAVESSHTLCLGLWKRGLWQDRALATVGQAQRLSLGLPESQIRAVLGENPPWQLLTVAYLGNLLPLPIPPDTHKYRRGRLLLVAGSRTYRGAAVLAALGARASGVGLLSVAVPQGLQAQVSAAVPEALVIPCPETPQGAIAAFPPHLDPQAFDTVALGPGLTLEPAFLVEVMQDLGVPQVWDADGLTLLAQSGAFPLSNPTAPRVLTPHPGEFRRLFPDWATADLTPGEKAQGAAQASGAIVVLKGACTAIAHPQGAVWIQGDSTPALARGGSGDVLTGLMGGLMAMAQAQGRDPATQVALAVGWHARAGLYGADRRSPLGVDAHHLSQCLIPALQGMLQP